MVSPPLCPTRTDTLFPYTKLCRSTAGQDRRKSERGDRSVFVARLHLRVYCVAQSGQYFEGLGRKPEPKAPGSSVRQAMPGRGVMQGLNNRGAVLAQDRSRARSALCARDQGGDGVYVAPPEREPCPAGLLGDSAASAEHVRPEERRVGKECARTCRFRWSPHH